MMLFSSDPQANIVASRMAEGALRQTIRKMHQTALRFPAGSKQRRLLRESADAMADTLMDWHLARESLCPHTGFPVEGRE